MPKTPDIAADKAELVALFVETLLYGIFIVLFYESIRILTGRYDGKKINWSLVLATVAIFATSTGHLLVIFLRALGAFIDHRNKPGGPLAYYNNLRSALEVCQASFQVAVSLLGDSMAIYRVFVVYDKRYIAIILPMISLCGTVVTSIASVVAIGQASGRDSVFYFRKLETWMPIFFGLTFSTSIICTGLIAIRLWCVSRRVASYVTHSGATGRDKPKLILIQRIMIESATMYSTIMLIYLVTYMEKTNYSIIFGDMVSPIIGIAFSLITIRVNTVFSPNTSVRTYRSETTMSPSSYVPNSRQTDWKEMKPFSVKIDKEVNRHDATSSATNVTSSEFE